MPDGCADVPALPRAAGIEPRRTLPAPHATLVPTRLCNPTGMAWEPHAPALWTVVNERGKLGNDLVPDCQSAAHDSAFYAWPCS